MSKTALISGITGQDGSYLAEFLLKKNYKVYGIIRRTSSRNTSRIDHILDKIELIEGDLADQSSLDKAIIESKPDEVYNLAAQSFNNTSWTQPEFTGNINGLGVVRILEAIRTGMKVLKKEIKFYQASSSQLFGEPTQSPQNENTPFGAKNPYTASKLYAHWMVKIYRESYNMFAVCGITFNHESPRRNVEFVTKKITREVAKIHLGISDSLLLGNLDGIRDWGFAGDFVGCAWLMLQQKKPEDFVIATGESHTVGDFVKEAFGLVNLDWKKYVKQDPRFMRRVEDENPLLGDSRKAKEKLGWEPKIKFRELVKMMLDYDIKELSEGKKWPQKQ